MEKLWSICLQLGNNMNHDKSNRNTRLCKRMQGHIGTKWTMAEGTERIGALEANCK